jgi:hypothetical protein
MHRAAGSDEEFYSDIAATHESSITAERERVKGEWHERVTELDLQLAAAQAFVGQAKNAMTGTGSWKLGDTPTTALDAAIAAAQQPLVALLIELRDEFLRCQGVDRALGKREVGMIDAALAKVKEGKA